MAKVLDFKPPPTDAAPPDADVIIIRPVRDGTDHVELSGIYAESPRRALLALARTFAELAERFPP